MNLTQKPLAELTEEAMQILYRELGTADTVRFLRQFSTGIGNYTEDRSARDGDESLDDVLAALSARREKKESSQ